VARPRTPIGTFGEIHLDRTRDGRARALTRFRDYDGQLRRVQATADTPKGAERKLKELLAERTDQTVRQGELTSASNQRLFMLQLDDLHRGPGPEWLRQPWRSLRPGGQTTVRRMLATFRDEYTRTFETLWAGSARDATEDFVAWIWTRPARTKTPGGALGSRPTRCPSSACCPAVPSPQRAAIRRAPSMRTVSPLR
jgi:hypothetical protein